MAGKRRRILAPAQSDDQTPSESGNVATLPARTEVCIRYKITASNKGFGIALGILLNEGITRRGSSRINTGRPLTLVVTEALLVSPRGQTRFGELTKYGAFTNLNGKPVDLAWVVKQLARKTSLPNRQSA